MFRWNVVHAVIREVSPVLMRQGWWQVWWMYMYVVAGMVAGMVDIHVRGGRDGGRYGGCTVEDKKTFPFSSVERLKYAPYRFRTTVKRRLKNG